MEGKILKIFTLEKSTFPMPMIKDLEKIMTGRNLDKEKDQDLDQETEAVKSLMGRTVTALIVVLIMALNIPSL
jgi:hypothetical protein